MLEENQNSETLLNLLSTGQPYTTNTIINIILKIII